MTYILYSEISNVKNNKLIKMDKEGNKINGISELNKKMNFENLKENQRTFKQESEEYSGKEVEV